MLDSNIFSLPTSFPNEPYSLRRTSDSSRPQPTGQCHFQLLHPAANNQICACQVYQLNRAAPGNVCDCGHSSCYHAHAPSDKSIRDLVASNTVSSSEQALLDRIKRLEEMVTAEQQIRESMIAQEREVREREVRILRETLAPFYRNEEMMRKKLLDLEDKIYMMMDDRAHARAIYGTTDDAHTVQGKSTKNLSAESERKHPQGNCHSSAHASHHLSIHDILSPDDTSVQSQTAQSVIDDVPGLTSSDERSSSSSYSRHHTPSETAIVAPSITSIGDEPETESPRSSGILNLVDFPRPAVPAYVMPRYAGVAVDIGQKGLPLDPDEPRSSGFLGLDVKERLKQRIHKKRPMPENFKSSSPTSSKLRTGSVDGDLPLTSHSLSNRTSTASATTSPPPSDESQSRFSSGRLSTPLTLPRLSPSLSIGAFASQSQSGDDHASKKRKADGSTNMRDIRDIMALDVLAHVSAASPLIS